MSRKMKDEISYPFPNFSCAKLSILYYNGTTVEILVGISNFIPSIVIDIITYPY